MNMFTINGKSYVPAKFSFNTVCEIEENGLPLEEMQKKPMSLARIYFAISAGVSTEIAGNEIEEHVKNGGGLEELMLAMSKELEDSDFFQSLTKRTETENTQAQKKTRQSK